MSFSREASRGRQPLTPDPGRRTRHSRRTLTAGRGARPEAALRDVRMARGGLQLRPRLHRGADSPDRPLPCGAGPGPAGRQGRRRQEAPPPTTGGGPTRPGSAIFRLDSPTSPSATGTCWKKSERRQRPRRAESSSEPSMSSPGGFEPSPESGSWMRPVYSDTASRSWARSPARPRLTLREGVIPIAALRPGADTGPLDPCQLAGAIASNAVGTVPDAVERLGPGPLRVLIEALCSGLARGSLRAIGSPWAPAPGERAPRPSPRAATPNATGIGRASAATPSGCSTASATARCSRSSERRILPRTLPRRRPRGVPAEPGRPPSRVLGAAGRLPRGGRRRRKRPGTTRRRWSEPPRSVVPACALGHLGRETPDPLLAEEILAEVQLVSSSWASAPSRSACSGGGRWQVVGSGPGFRP